MTIRDREIIRELAKKYMELAHLPVNDEREMRIRRNNALIPGRPIVWIHEVPWHEMDIDGQLQLHCEDPFARKMEWFFRENLFRWKYMQADMVLEKKFRVNRAITDSGFGMTYSEKLNIIDEKNNINSHHYFDQLDCEEKIEQLKIPVLTARPDEDRENVARAEEVLDGIMPVCLTGQFIYHAPWDMISRLRGVEPLLMDMIADPDLMHAIMRKFVEIGTARIDQLEAMGAFSPDVPDVHCTPPYIDELSGTGAKSTWYRGMAQIFSSVSPAMHKEFEIDYIRPLAERFGLTYYGCCEPLHDRIDLLRTIPNLRKIGVSPWADVDRSAEEMGGDFVYARKPNPAMVAGTLNEDAVREEIRGTVRACLRYGCPCEMVLKDISTVSYKPGNLFRWSRIVQETLDEFY